MPESAVKFGSYEVGLRFCCEEANTQLTSCRPPNAPLLSLKATMIPSAYHHPHSSSLAVLLEWSRKPSSVRKLREQM